MEKRIGAVSAVCFLMIGITIAMGILIENAIIGKIAVLCGCLVVVWLTTLNFRTIKLMKQQAEASAPVIPDLIHWLQSETWPEILSLEKIKNQFPRELELFLETHPDCEEASIKGYRIWRSEETEKYFDQQDMRCQQILVMINKDRWDFQVFGSIALQQAMEERV